MLNNNFLPLGDHKTKENILIVGTTFPRWNGDKVPAFIYEFCQSIKNKYNVFVLAPHYKGAKRKEIMEGLHVHRFMYALPRMETLGYTTSILSSLHRNILTYIFVLPLFVFCGALNIAKLVLKYRIHILHIHWILPFGFIGAFLKKFKKIKLVFTSHGGDISTSESGFLSGFKRKIIKYSIDNADVYTVVSKMIKEKVLKICGIENEYKIDVLSMGLDYKKFSIERKNRFIPPYRVVFVGRLSHIKGIDYLIDAIQLLVDEEDITCDLYGDGADRKYFEEKVKQLGLENNITFHGFIPHSDLPNKLILGDIFIGPSTTDKTGSREGLGLVFLEAMAAGIPVIATNTGGIPEIVKDGETGLLVPEKDSKAIAEKISLLIRNRQLRNKLIKNGKELAKKFDWKVIGENYLEVYKR
jgi:glycosyltransferase involved in cell wall biosynthesis